MKAHTEQKATNHCGLFFSFIKKGSEQTEKNDN